MRKFDHPMAKAFNQLNAGECFIFPLGSECDVEIGILLELENNDRAVLVPCPLNKTYNQTPHIFPGSLFKSSEILHLCNATIIPTIHPSRIQFGDYEIPHTSPALFQIGGEMIIRARYKRSGTVKVDVLVGSIVAADLSAAYCYKEWSIGLPLEDGRYDILQNYSIQ